MTKTLKIDSLDLRILTSLHNNGRITKVDLGEEVGLSPTPCYERMKRMEESRVIRGYHADIDLSPIVQYSYFWVQIRLNDYTKEKSRIFEKMIFDRKDIIECQAILGGADYLVKIAAKSVQDYHSTLEELSEREEFSYDSFPISKEIKQPHQSSLIEMTQQDYQRK